MRVLSLFSGVGGLDLGVKLALPDASVVGYVEKDEYCRKILTARMQDGWLDEAPIHDDITTFCGRDWRGRIDLICGGFPCQDISGAGRREGIRDGARSGLWFEFVRVIGEVEPGYVFVENVSALLGRGMGDVLGELSSLGFDAEWGVVSACAVGAPHTRERVFLLAYSRCLPGEWRLVSQYRPAEEDNGDAEEWGEDRQLAEVRAQAAGGVRGSWWRGFEPGFPRMVKRVPDRMDRLRALGNAVVPLAAARAFSALAARIAA